MYLFVKIYMLKCSSCSGHCDAQLILCCWKSCQETALHSHLRGLPQLQLKNAASLKALCSAQGSPHPNAHFYRGRSPDLSPNLGQCWKVTSSLELPIASVEASIETASLYLYLYPNLLSPLSFLWGFQQHSSINFLHANLCLRDCVSRNLTYDRDDRASCQQVFLKWFRRKTKSYCTIFETCL